VDFGLRLTAAAAIAAAMTVTTAYADEAPKRGGTLTYMIAADAPPSFDGHREQTFAMIHPVAPFYSLLVRVNPENPASNDFVCDLCTEMPKPTDDSKTYTFTIRDGVKFHDGSPLTAADVAASWNRIIFPPEGVTSARSANYKALVDKVESPDPKTVVFRLKFATTAFIPAIADSFNFIYKKEILDKDQHWFEKNIMGSGPFKFVSYEGRAIDQGRALRRLLPQGASLSGWYRGCLCAEASDPHRRDARRPRRHRLPRPAAIGGG
jgi:peptide/nickel transport system substrate-binding protein